MGEPRTSPVPANLQPQGGRAGPGRDRTECPRRARRHPALLAWPEAARAPPVSVRVRRRRVGIPSGSGVGSLRGGLDLPAAKTFILGWTALDLGGCLRRRRASFQRFMLKGGICLIYILEPVL